MVARGDCKDEPNLPDVRAFRQEQSFVSNDGRYLARLSRTAAIVTWCEVRGTAGEVLFCSQQATEAPFLLLVAKCTLYSTSQNNYARAHTHTYTYTRCLFERDRDSRLTTAQPRGSGMRRKMNSSLLDRLTTYLHSSRFSYMKGLNECGKDVLCSSEILPNDFLGKPRRRVDRVELQLHCSGCCCAGKHTCLIAPALRMLYRDSP